MLDDYSDAPVCVQKFLQYKKSTQGRSALTVLNYYHDLLTFSRYLLLKRDKDAYKGRAFEDISFSEASDELLKTVTRGEIIEFSSYCDDVLKNQKNARSRKLSCIRQFYKYLSTTISPDEGGIKNNPAVNIDSPGAAKRQPKFLTLDQSVHLLESVSGGNAVRDFAMITLFLNCGLRVSELVGIDLRDFDKDMNTLRVIGKGSKERIVYLNDACRKAVRDYIAVRPNDDLIKPEARKALFISRNRERISVRAVQNLIYKHLEEAGYGNQKLSVHKLRHTAATLMYTEGGTDVLVLKEILGHESLATTQIYTHLQSKKLIEAAENNPLAHGVRRIAPVSEPKDDADDEEE